MYSTILWECIQLTQEMYFRHPLMTLTEWTRSLCHQRPRVKKNSPDTLLKFK